MKPFEKALIQSILDDYDKILSNSPPSNHQNSHGTVKQNSQSCKQDTTLNNTSVAQYSLWIEKESKNAYLTPRSSMKQIFFRNQEGRSSCIRLLAMQGYTIHE